VEAYNFELKLALISMVQQAQFGVGPMEDSNLHPLVFSDVCDTLKLNGVLTDAIRLQLFCFSFFASKVNYYCKAFLSKLCSSNKMTNLRKQIATFAQREDENKSKKTNPFFLLCH